MNIVKKKRKSYNKCVFKAITFWKREVLRKIKKGGDVCEKLR